MSAADKDGRVARILGDLHACLAMELGEHLREMQDAMMDRAMPTDEGDWACTCGSWHPPAQRSCGKGDQITKSGEDWW